MAKATKKDVRHIASEINAEVFNTEEDPTADADNITEYIDVLTEDFDDSEALKEYFNWRYDNYYPENNYKIVSKIYEQARKEALAKMEDCGSHSGYLAFLTERDC